MACGGEFRGTAGREFRFRLKPSGTLQACTGRLVVIDLATGGRMGTRTYNRAELENGIGWPMEAQRIYRINLLRIPSDAQVEVEVMIDGQVRNDSCSASDPLIWSVFVF